MYIKWHISCKMQKQKRNKKYNLQNKILISDLEIY